MFLWDLPKQHFTKNCDQRMTGELRTLWIQALSKPLHPKQKQNQRKILGDYQAYIKLLK